ncbi:hypothetical protein SUT286_05930 [Streptococcus parasuis]|nr:hypothetical protein SUT286_05930 [Streptococcus parasuis]
MKIHKTINPVAVQNTYYLESDTHLIVVDPGSDWNKIHDKIEQIGKPITAILSSLSVNSFHNRCFCDNSGIFLTFY